MDNSLKAPPSNIEVEKSVLYTIAVAVADCNEMIAGLEEEDFYDLKNKKIFKIIKSFFNTQKPIDPVSIGSQLDIEGKVYLTNILDLYPVTNEEWAIGELRAHKYLRKFITLGNVLMKRGFEGKVEAVEETVKFLQNSLLQITADRESKRGWVHIAEVVMEAVERAEELGKSCGLSGVPTGFKDIDSALCGLQRGDLVIVAGRPSMGKTAFAANCAANAAALGNKVGFFSLEMEKIQIANRLLAMYGKIDGTKFRSGKFNQEEWDRIISSAGMIYKWGIYIDDSPTANYQDIYHRVYQLKAAKDGVDVVFIDYLSFLDGDKANGNRVLEIQSITRGLKRVAKELNVAVVLLSQLNRQCEMRPNKRPILADLRESGAAEQDADVVIFLYRHAYYMKLEGRAEDENGEETEEYKKVKNLAEILIAKQRNGPTGVEMLFWDETTTRFRDFIPESRI